MVYKCLIEPRINEYLTNYYDIPDECFSTTSTEGIILTVLIFMLLSGLLQILLNLLHKGGVSKLLIFLEKKFNLHLPKEDNFENIKLIEIVRLLVIAIILFLIVTSFVLALMLFSNYLASLALNATGWTLS